jgi:hypothetical protein
MRNMLVIAILAYRLIPNGVRGIWSADSSSGKALEAIRSGAPIVATLRRYAVPRGASARGLSWNDFEVWSPPSWDN